MSRPAIRLPRSQPLFRALVAGGGLFLLAGTPVFAGDIMDVVFPGGFSPVTLLALVGGATSVGFLMLVGLIDQLKEGGCPEGLKRLLGGVGAGGVVATIVLFAATWPGRGYPEPDLAKLWAPEAVQARLDGGLELEGYGPTSEDGKYHVPVARAMESLVLDASLLEGQELKGPSWETKSPAERGQAIFEGLAGSKTAGVTGYAACKTCHARDGSRLVGPPLNGRWGTQSPTSAGSVVFDRDYVAESLRQPLAKVADSYPPAMPAQTMPDELIDAIVAYLQSL